MQDVHHLIDELKVRDMKLIMDLVVNHTSNEVRRRFELFVLFTMADFI
jgi:pullulanase/glycogen debranching enzyme